MNQPLGNYSGLLCEVMESIDTLKGNGPKDLKNCLSFNRKMYVFSRNR